MIAGPRVALAASLAADPEARRPPASTPEDRAPSILPEPLREALPAQAVPALVPALAPARASDPVQEALVDRVLALVALRPWLKRPARNAPPPRAAGAASSSIRRPRKAR